MLADDRNLQTAKKMAVGKYFPTAIRWLSREMAVGKHLPTVIFWAVGR